MKVYSVFSSQFLMAAIAALGFWLRPELRAAPWSSLLQQRQIRLATEGAFAPMNFKKGSLLTGFEVEVANEVIKRLGLRPLWKTAPFDSLLIGLNQDRYDLVVASHSITEERSKAVDFTQPHYCTGGILVTRPGGALRVADLKDKVVVVQTGSAFLEHMKKGIASKRVKTLARDTEALQDLLSARADVWITDKFVAREAIRSHPEAKLQSGELVFQDRVAMAVAKGNSALREHINSALADIMKDGSYLKISQKYFQEDISCR